jgi:hypothetical protein
MLGEYKGGGWGNSPVIEAAERFREIGEELAGLKGLEDASAVVGIEVAGGEPPLDQGVGGDRI